MRIRQIPWGRGGLGRVVRSEVFKVDITQDTDSFVSLAKDLRHHPVSNEEPRRCLRQGNSIESRCHIELCFSYLTVRTNYLGIFLTVNPDSGRLVGPGCPASSHVSCWLDAGTFPSDTLTGLWITL